MAGVTRDYLELEYKGDDRVFVPSRPAREDQPLRRRRTAATRRSRSSAASAGSTIKPRARQAAQELAGELLKLYAERRAPRRPRVPAADDEWQREFEATFPFDETPDQRDAIDAREGRHGEPRARWTA